jgi:hypothetical protein
MRRSGTEMALSLNFLEAIVSAVKTTHSFQTKGNTQPKQTRTKQNKPN